VVLKGTDLPEMIGKDVNLVVGFAFDSASASWTQVNKILFKL
jgi:hypothetical protein